MTNACIAHYSVSQENTYFDILMVKSPELLPLCFLYFLSHHTCCKSSLFSVFLCAWLMGTAWKIDAICTHREVKERTPKDIESSLTVCLLVCGSYNVSFSLKWNHSRYVAIHFMVSFKIIWLVFLQSNIIFPQHSILLWITWKIEFNNA